MFHQLCTTAHVTQSNARSLTTVLKKTASKTVMTHSTGGPSVKATTLIVSPGRRQTDTVQAIMDCKSTIMTLQLRHRCALKGCGVVLGHNHTMSVQRRFGESSYTLRRKKVPCDKALFNEIWKLMPPAHVNPMNPSTFVERRQGTWGEVYAFGKQVSPKLGPLETAPRLVQLCLEAAGSDLCRFQGLACDDLTVAHVNWYNGGKAALGFHQDVEPTIEGRPIWSFTFIADDFGVALTRKFSIAKDNLGKNIVDELQLGNGDMLVMEGAFQKDLWHGVKRTHRKDHVNQRRINVTIRPWGKMT